MRVRHPHDIQQQRYREDRATAANQAERKTDDHPAAYPRSCLEWVHLRRSVSRSRRVASQGVCVLLLPLLNRLPRSGQMLRWWKRAEERRIGRVGGLERAVGKISLVAEPVRPRVTIDENSNVERILRAKYRVCVIGAERHVGANKVSRRDRSCH